MADRTTIVIDTSVVVKWFSDEEHTDAALRLRESYVNNEIDLYAPDLLVYELGNALRYNPTFGPADVTKGVRSVLDMDFTIVTPSSRVVDTAIELAYEHGLTVYDATYVALAQAIGATVVTTDDDITNIENVTHLSTY